MPNATLSSVEGICCAAGLCPSAVNLRLDSGLGVRQGPNVHPQSVRAAGAALKVCRSE